MGERGSRRAGTSHSVRLLTLAVDLVRRRLSDTHRGLWKLVREAWSSVSEGKPALGC